MTGQLSGFHQNTHDAVFRHPAVRNPAWRDARSMLRSLAEVAPEPNGNLNVTRHGQTPALYASLGKNPYCGVLS